MSSSNSFISKLSARRWWWVTALLVALVLIGTALSMIGSSESKIEIAEKALYTVEEAPLTISVTSSGNVRSSNAKVIHNKVEGRTTIIWLIPEGTHVEKGDKLMELDSSSLEDQLVNDELDVQTSKANLVTARENLELAKKQGESDIDSAKVNLRLALLDLEKYTGRSIWEILNWDEKSYDNVALTNLAERVSAVNWSQVDLAGELQTQRQGQFAQELEQAQNNIDKIDMQLAQAKDQYKGSSNLFHRGYITETEYESDRLSYQTTKLDLQLAKTEKELLQEFTKRRKLEELMSAVDQQAFLVEKAVLTAASSVRDAQAKLNAQQESYNRQVSRLKKTKEQLAACTITAPQAGMVVYGTTGQDRWDDDQPLDEGVEVRERQELFRLPASDQMTADVKIHESMLEKVKEGLPVKITTDAIPNREFEGHVKKIALMPDSQSRWLNPDLKVYNTEVAITSGAKVLRPGMSCQAEIIVKEFDSTKYVPIQAVIRVDGQPTVYVVGPNGRPQKRVVQVGLDNNRMIRIVSGLQTGEQVLLNPPMEEGAKRIGKESGKGKSKSGEEKKGKQERGRPEEERPNRGGGRDGMTGRDESASERDARAEGSRQLDGGGSGRGKGTS